MPAPVQLVARSWMQVPSAWQQAPAPAWQLTCCQVARRTQSPLGRQRPLSVEKRAQPPLGGQPKEPQLTASSQLLLEFWSPLLSTHMKALQQVGGALKQGSWVWLLW